MYRKLLKPFHQRAIEWAHAKGIKAHLHSCGDVRPFVPELIAIGLDALNPLEVKAGMDPSRSSASTARTWCCTAGSTPCCGTSRTPSAAEMERVVPVVKEIGRLHLLVRPFGAVQRELGGFPPDHESREGFGFLPLMESIYQKLDELLRAGETVAVATIIDVKGSVPREVGAKMIIHPLGRHVGTVGGGCGEADVIKAALDVIQTGEPAIVRADLTEDISMQALGVCGGIMDVFVERMPRGGELTGAARCGELRGVRSQESGVRSQWAGVSGQ